MVGEHEPRRGWGLFSKEDSALETAKGWRPESIYSPFTQALRYSGCEEGARG